MGKPAPRATEAQIRPWRAVADALDLQLIRRDRGGATATVGLELAPRRGEAYVLTGVHINAAAAHGEALLSLSFHAEAGLQRASSHAGLGLLSGGVAVAGDMARLSGVTIGIVRA
mgnify:CR=1 FL=1